MLDTPGVFEPQIVLHGPKEARNHLRLEADRLAFVRGQHLTDANEGHADKKKATEMSFSG
jgi:hypothetical protein